MNNKILSSILSSAKVAGRSKAKTNNQKWALLLTYLNQLAWTNDWWDNLPVEVIDYVGYLDPHILELCYEFYAQNVPVPHDNKLEAEEPQEVVSEPQEDCLSTTEDIMNNSTIIPSWEVSGYVNLVDLDFSTATTIAYIPEVIPDFWEGDAVETAVINNLAIKPVVQLLPASKEVKLLPMGKEVVEVEQQPQPKLTPDELADVRASVARTCAKMERRTCYGSPVRHGSPTITTKSGKVVPVSPHAVTPHGDAPKANHITKPKVVSAIGEAEAIAPTQLNIFQQPEYTIQVANCKTELLDSSDFEEVISITRKYNATDKQIVLDAKTTMTKREIDYLTGLKKAYTMIKESEAVKSAPKATPVVTHNQMMTAIRKLNGGRIPNAVVLNKLVTGYVTRNNAIVASVSKYIAPTLLEIVEKAYAQLTA